MADAKQYNAVTGFNPADAPGGSAGSEPPSKILSEDIRDLKYDLWAGFWGPGPNTPNWNSGDEADRRIGWNQDPDGRYTDSQYESNTSINFTKLGGVSGNPASGSGDNSAVTSTSVSVTTPTDTTDNSGDETPIDFVTQGSGYTYPTVTGPAYYQIHAILGRVNDAIVHTGHGSSSNATIPLLSTAGAYTKYDGSAASALTEDTGRVSKRHLDRMSDDIEYIRNTSNHRHNYIDISNSAIFDYQNNKGNAIWGGTWGDDSYSNQWGNYGADSGYDRPFAEWRYRFTNWNHLRYWLNQGGKFYFRGNHNPTGNLGNPTWNAIMNFGHFYIGQSPAEYATLNSNTSWQNSNGGAYTVTDHVPTFHGIGDKANAVQTGTGADVSNFSVTKSTAWTNVVAGDIIRVGDYYEGEVASVDTTTVTDDTITLVQKLRNTSGTETSSLSNQTWCISKWYRCGYVKGESALYGGLHDPSADDGYMYLDWRLGLGDGTNHDVFFRIMCDNTVNQMTMDGNGNGFTVGWRTPLTVNEFVAQNTPAIARSYATAEINSSSAIYERRLRATFQSP